ncbi:DUF1583 domain-containing protein [Rhodopirellula bahusiensis]|uniref:FKBP-rapamycin associated protein n=1 Tax=Rhodopirellula bahusiensis TaxID=2014065 RepID=A0A2G1WE20_9BACT|nr:DUF1583 domain-containing protein [Rhodopirellula bahusiensis]PHQ37305.1 FKBP-rapamycin associated protein [Rhodopirellula bahusiensis]
MIKTSRVQIVLNCFAIVLALVVWHGVGQRSLLADDRTGRSDEVAAAWIMNDQHASDSGATIDARAEDLAPDEHFLFLRSWVLPGPSYPGLRITADYGIVDDQQRQRPEVDSPALKLVHVAKQLDLLSSLSEAVLGYQAKSPSDRCDQLVLVILVAFEMGDAPLVEKHVDELLKLIRSDESLLEHSRDGIVLLAQQATKTPTLTTAIRELVLFTTLAYRKEYDRPAWIRHLVAAQAKLNDPVKADERSAREASQWYTGSLERAFEHGNAFPHPLPVIERGSYRNPSNYGDDFVFFQSPVQGDYSVDAMATGFGYREAHLLVGGYYAGLVYNHTQSMLGNVRQELGRTSIGEPLTDTHRYGVLRTRVRVRDGVVTTSVNGREIHRQDVGDSVYPWLGVRTNYRVQGGVDNLRITGNPVIPKSIEMVESSDLLGWYDYYQDPGNRPNQLANWSGNRVEDSQGDSTTEITDPRLGYLPRGSHVEHLLRYIRPMVEDGVIEYEFWYDGEQWMAHPALGRTCYLIRETGVTEHRLTDGRYDRRGLRADNERGRGSKQDRLDSLRLNDWNQMQLQRRGDEVILRLNGEVIHNSEVETDGVNPCFGLFHFADQSSLRVRNVRWIGDWPTELPPIEKQLLADDFDGSLDWTASEPGKKLNYRINRDSFARGKFVQVEGDPAKTVVASNEGMVISQFSETGYRGTLVAPDIQVGGDFDVIVAYDQMQCESLKEKIGSVRLHLVADTAEEDMALIQRVEDRSNDQLMQCLRMATVNGEQRRNYFGRIPCDNDAGRLRLSRRGDKVFYLAADGDSDYFYLLGEEQFVTDDLQPLGIQFGVQIQGPNGRVSTRFTELQVRAERLEGANEVDASETFASLNKYRELLPVSMVRDFTRSPVSPAEIYRWGNVQQTASGLKVTAPGTDEWSSAGISLRHRIEGDFDIAFFFDPLQLPTPTQNLQTQLYLQIEWSNDESTQVDAMLSKSDSGAIVSRAMTRTLENGKSTYKIIGNHPYDNPDYFRITRRGNMCFCITGRQAGGQPLMLGAIPVSDEPIDPRRVRVVLHTGGEGRTSEVLLKSIHVRADAATLDVPLPATNRNDRVIVVPTPAKPKPQPTSIFESFRNLFR